MDAKKQIVDAVNPLLNVKYTDTDQEGPIRRLDIVEPRAPEDLISGQGVTVLYEGQKWRATMKDSWKAPQVETLTGAKSQIIVLFKTDRTWGGVSRENITPFAPTNTELYADVEAKFKGKFLPGIALQAWRSGRAKVRG